MLLIDLSQIMTATLMAEYSKRPREVDENLLRHMILMSIKANKVAYQEYGEVVLACDANNVWRKSVYPYYKANRKKNRDKSEFDWPMIYKCFAKIRDEIRDNFTYPVVCVDGAEGDDVIATIVKNTNEPTLIISGDKDFVQIHDKNVKQYDPTRKKWVSCDDVPRFLLEHIIRGDRVDGIPNIISEDDCLVMGIRQKSITTKKVDIWVNQTPEEFCDSFDMMRRFNRNKTLIDLNYIPDYISVSILEAYHSQSNKPNKVFDYFIKNNLKLLLSDINDF